MDCKSYQDYCHKYSSRCQNAHNTTHATFPYFQSQGNNILSEVIMDYSYWFLKSSAVISASCTDESIPQGVYGLLGMGINGDSLTNFLEKRPTFAIQIAKNLTNGSLSFDVDTKTKAKSQNPATTLASNDNWHVVNISSIKVDRDTLPVTASMIFDLGSDSIGLPLDVYTQVIQSIEKAPSIGGCSTNPQFQPVCNFTGDIKKLPSIILNVGNETLEIPPRVYVVQTQDSDYYYDPITLKFKVLSTDATQGSLVTADYDNYIILGYPMMSYYYTVFEGSYFGVGGATISLYVSSEYSEPNAMTWIFVVVGVVGVILIGAIYYMVKKVTKKRKIYNAPLLGGQEDAQIKATRNH